MAIFENLVDLKEFYCSLSFCWSDERNNQILGKCQIIPILFSNSPKETIWITVWKVQTSFSIQRGYNIKVISKSFLFSFPFLRKSNWTLTSLKIMLFEKLLLYSNTCFFRVSTYQGLDSHCRSLCTLWGRNQRPKGRFLALRIYVDI